MGEKMEDAEEHGVFGSLSRSASCRPVALEVWSRRRSSTATSLVSWACRGSASQARISWPMLIHQIWLFTNIDGTLASKSDDLSSHRSGQLRITRMEPTNRHLLHLGATSVVSVRMNAEAIMNGVSVAATLRYTRVWHKRT